MLLQTHKATVALRPVYYQIDKKMHTERDGYVVLVVV